MVIMKPETRSRSRRRGATVVEAALVLPILISVMLAIMEGGWLVKNNLLLANAVREGARAASLGKVTTDIRSLVTRRTAPLTVTTTIQYSVDGDQTFFTTGDKANYNNAPTGAMMRVTVRTRHQPLTGFFPFLKNRDVVAQAEFNRE